MIVNIIIAAIPIIAAASFTATFCELNLLTIYVLIGARHIVMI
jgi:hypothetical protein